jgi:hypothetical protein
MACLVHVALGRWRAMADDLDAMGFLKERIDRDDLAAALAVEVTEVWPLAGSFGADSFLVDGSAQEGGLLAERLAEGRIRPELGLGQGLSFGKLAKVPFFSSPAQVMCVIAENVLIPDPLCVPPLLSVPFFTLVLPHRLVADAL